MRLPQLHDLRGTPDHVVEWYRAGLEPTESRHVLQVANRRGGRLDALAQTVDDGSLCLRDHSVACQHRDARGDAAQRVAEIVGHRRGQLADDRELLVLEQRLTGVR